MNDTVNASPAYVPAPAEERVEIVDALYRFCAGQDLRDQPLFESAFAGDAVLDFSQPAQQLGLALEPFVGRATIADNVFSTIAPLDTTHTATNARLLSYDGARASLVALMEAQHLDRADHTRRLLLKNIFRLELAKQAEGWVITHMKIDTVWREGDPAVLFPAS